MTDELDRAAAALLAGEVVMLPTDTVYGIAALPSVPGATTGLFRLKDRAAGQPFAVLVADVAQARELVAAPGVAGERLMAAYWPGPLTLVLDRSPGAAALELGGDPSTVGVRCPDHDLVRALATRVGPLATTSANRHGEPTPPTAVEAAGALDGPVAVVVDGGRLEGVASTVVDLTGGVVRVLREGDISAEAIAQVAAGR